MGLPQVLGANSRARARDDDIVRGIARARSLLFVAASCELVVDGDVNIITLVGVSLLLTGVFFVQRLVRQFR